MRFAKVGGIVAAAVMLGLVGFGAHSTHALAYGQQDHPLAQIEFSGNCTNPDFPFCAPEPDGVGLGGIWLWVEVDDGGTADITGSVCDHTYRGEAGALAINGETSWALKTSADFASATPSDQILAFIDPAFIDPNDQYYAVDVPGSGPFPGETLWFPATPGHYTLHPAPGVALELQIAP